MAAVEVRHLVPGDVFERKSVEHRVVHTELVAPAGDEVRLATLALMPDDSVRRMDVVLRARLVVEKIEQES